MARVAFPKAARVEGEVQRMNARLKNLLVILAVIGPGIVTASVDNDAGGITTYSVAGAHYGYSLLWTLIPITIALIVVQEMSARMGVVTGQGLADLIRENFGVKVTFYMMLGLLFANLGNVVAEFAGVAASGEIFGIPRYVSVPISALLVWWLVVGGTYDLVEKVFLTASAFYATYVISGFLARPDWGQVFHQAVSPSLSFKPDYLMMVIGLVGTTIAPWMQFYLQSAVVEKGIKIRDYRYSRLDVIVGSFVTDLVAFFIIVTCAATLFARGIGIETAADAAIALQPLAGKFAAALFAFGLYNASVFSASILPLSTAYSVCEGMGWETGISKRFREAPQFFGLYTGLIIAGVAIVLIPGAPLLTLMLLSQVVNGILLPVILIFILILINNRRLMGDYVNSRFFNGVALVTTVGMAGLTLVWVVASVPGLFK